MYEESYVIYFGINDEALDFVIKYQDVYDNHPSNVNSGTDYDIQERPSTHLHDIAIRRALKMLGVWFTGEESRNLEIRGSDSEGGFLSPGEIPFTALEMISSEEPKNYSNLGKWWKDGSIEDFWQQNKLLQVAIQEQETDDPSQADPVSVVQES